MARTEDNLEHLVLTLNNVIKSAATNIGSAVDKLAEVQSSLTSLIDAIVEHCWMVYGRK